MDINSILSQFTQSGNQRLDENSAMAERMEADTQQITNLLSTNVQESQAVIAASTQLATRQAELDYQVSKSKEAYTALAGMNPEDLNNEYVKSVAAYDSAERDRMALETQRAQTMRTAEQLSGVSLLDNPVDYLFAQLALPTVAARHNSILNQEIEAVQRRDAASRNVAARVELIKQKDSVIAANTADTMLGISKARAEVASKTATIQLRQATADNISKLGTRALDAYRLGNDRFQVQSDILSKQLTVAQWATQQAALQEQRIANRQIAEARLKDAKEKDDMEAVLNERLAAASAALGYAEPFTVLSIKLLPKDKQDNLVEVAMSGRFGNTLPDALNTVRVSGQINTIKTTNPGMGKFIEYTANGLKVYADEVVNDITVGKLPKTTKVAEEAGVNYSFDVTQSMGSFAARNSLNSNRWNSGGIFNPYKPQYLMLADEAAGGGLPMLKGNSLLPVITRLRADLSPSDTNLRGKDMENLVLATSQQVANGTLGLDKAAQDLIQLHQVAAAKNLQLFNYTQFGLPQQTSTIVTIPPVTAFGEPYKIDLMNPANVKMNMARMAREQRIGTIGMLNQPLVDPATLGVRAPGQPLFRPF